MHFCKSVYFCVQVVLVTEYLIFMQANTTQTCAIKDYGLILEVSYRNIQEH